MDTKNLLSPEQLKNADPGEFTQFEFATTEHYICIRLLAELTVDGFNTLVRKSAELEGKGLPLILDCGKMASLDSLWSRYVVQVKLALKNENKSLVLTNCSPDFLQDLVKQGIDSGLKLTKNLSEAETALNIPKPAAATAQAPKVDVRLVNPFLESTMEVMNTMGKAAPTPEPIFAKPIPATPSGDLCGVIPVVSPTFRGCIIISFPKETLLKFAGKIMGMEVKDVDQTVLDALGEATNIIFTRGKSILNNQGFGIESAIPKVYASDALPEEFADKQGVAVVVPFQTDIGSFTSEIRSWSNQT